MTKTLLAVLCGAGIMLAAYSTAGAQNGLLQPALPLLAPTPAPSSSPAAEASPTVDIGAGQSYETLTNNQPPWNDTYVLVTRRSGAHTAYGLLEDTDRFNKHDQRLTVGDYFPIDPRWSGFVEAAYSPNHQILPIDSFAAGGQYASGGNWYEGLIARHTEYTGQSVNSGLLNVEAYWKSFRAYYGLTVAQLNGTGPDIEHTFALSYYYGPTNNSLDLSYTTGREVENVGLPNLLISHVDDWTLGGRQWIGANTFVHYGMSVYIQGTSYTRTGGFLELNYRL